VENQLWTVKVILLPVETKKVLHIFRCGENGPSCGLRGLFHKNFAYYYCC